MPDPIRTDFDAHALRAIARKTKDGPQARSLLALAAIYEGASRTEAARIGGVTVQIVRDWGSDEFAAGASEPPDEPTRRHFLKVMGASLALSSAGGCLNQPQETIVPYVRAPEHIIPGKPLYYATAMTHAGNSIGPMTAS